MSMRLRHLVSVLALCLALGCQSRTLEAVKPVTIYRWAFNETHEKQLPSGDLFDLVRLTASDFPQRFQEFRSVRVIRNAEGRTYSFSLRGVDAASDDTLRAFRLQNSDIVYFVSPDYF